MPAWAACLTITIPPTAPPPGSSRRPPCLQILRGSTTTTASPRRTRPRPRPTSSTGYYARPAMLALAGDVAGRRILDAGCGSGPLFAALRDRGAVVTGFDKSAGMLELARRRLGDDADLQVAELGSPLLTDSPDGTGPAVTGSRGDREREDPGPALLARFGVS